MGSNGDFRERPTINSDPDGGDTIGLDALRDKDGYIQQPEYTRIAEPRRVAYENSQPLPGSKATNHDALLERLDSVPYPMGMVKEAATAIRELRESEAFWFKHAGRYKSERDALREQVKEQAAELERWTNSAWVKAVIKERDDAQALLAPCGHGTVKTITTNTGMVYVCESCSHHWYSEYNKL
jgi:hypothetical protein